MNEQPDDLRELAKKTAKSIVDHGSVPMATLKESIILQEKVDELLAKEIQFPEIPEPKEEITITNLSELGDNLVSAFSPILEKMNKPGKDGENYILTEKDKREIASKIKVPVVEKIIERVETILEKPIVTNEIKEVAVTDTPKEIVAKLESLKDEERLDISAIKGLEKQLESKQTNFGHVIRAITAGTNITVDDTDPNRPIISSTGGGASLTVQDIDGTPTVSNVTAIKFTNGAVTDNGDGTVNVTTGSGGGGDVSSNTATSVDSEIAIFSGTGGKTIKRATTTGILKGVSGVISAATSGTDYSAGTSALGTGIVKSTTGTGALTIAVAGDFPTLNQSTTGSAATLTTPRTIGTVTGDATSAGSSFDGSANNTNALTLATVNANVGSFTNASLTVNGKGLITAASNGTAPVTSVGATAPITTSGGVTPTISTSMATNKLIGRGTAGTGVFEEITLGTNLSLTGTTLNATGGGGSTPTGTGFTHITAGVQDAAAKLVDTADINNSQVTLAKQADVATSTVFYRKTAGTGVPEVQTLATLKTDLGLTGTNTGDQTITNSSDATSHTVTLSASGGSIQLVEGSNITLTTAGTGSAGIVTIASTGGGSADYKYYVAVGGYI